jgi:hypothetical protein
MAIDFPASPTNGQTFTSGSVTYTYDGTKWTAVAAGGGATDIISEGNTSAEVIDTGSDGRFVVTTEGTERLRVDSSGRVGVGTASPAVTLHTQGTIRTSRSNGEPKYIDIYHSGGEGFIDSVNGDSGTAAPVIFRSGNSSSTTERARIDSSGRLLVGTSTSLESNSLFQVYKSTGNSNVYLDVDTLSNSQAASYWVRGGSPDRNAILGIFKHSGITNPGPFLRLDEEDGGTDLYWTDNSGNLRVSGNYDHIGTTSGTVVGTQTSDERLKNIIGPVEYGLDTIKQINPVRYTFKSEPETEKIGFIAQQVLPLVPQSVFDTDEHIEGEPEDAPTKLGMEYVALIPVLVNAVKELSAEVDALKAQLQAS